MKEKTLNRIEGIGLVIILLSFLIQLLQSNANSEKQEYENYKIHNKMDHIWAVISKDYADTHSDDSVYFSINFKHYVDDWKIYTQGVEETKYLDKEINILGRVSIFCFILGSLMLIIPKFIIKK